jgi:hypothetical protein
MYFDSGIGGQPSTGYLNLEKDQQNTTGIWVWKEKKRRSENFLSLI